MPSTTQQIREITDQVVDALRVCESQAAARADAEANMAHALSSLMAVVDDEALKQIVRNAASARAQFDMIVTVGAGLISKRSEPQLGYAGLAAREGRRSAVDLVQSLTGEGRADAARQVRFGAAMGEADAAARLAEISDDGISDDATAKKEADDANAPNASDEPSFGNQTPWFEPITRAVASGGLTAAGGDALMRGLGTPTEACDADVLREAAEELLTDAAGANTDELLKRARWMRDKLDPARVAARAEERYQNRKARIGRNGAGVMTAWLEFDDESRNMIDGIIRSGLSPRLGGPRFVDKAKAARAQGLVDDPRSYEQLVFDLLMAVMKAGTLADPDVLLGGQQHGLRVVITKHELDRKDAEGNLVGAGYVEDAGEAAPAATVERMLCDTGVTEITVDGKGDPLNVGRERRLFTAKQRVALAIRDGGCMEEDCPFPASMTEAHHLNEWHADHGRTDLADGILLCKFHHLRVHNQGWKVVREANQYFMIPPASIDPSRTPILLRPKAPWRQQKKAG